MLTKRIVCAANKFNNIVLVGPRHWDNTMRSQYNRSLIKPDRELFEQGFINTWGEFLSREDAWMVASANNQIKQLVGGQVEEDKGVHGTKLYSENLY